MQGSDFQAQFTGLKQLRRQDPAASLAAVGMTVSACLRALSERSERAKIEWRGKGDKTYDVYVSSVEPSRFSRAVRRDLFLTDPADFSTRWDGLVSRIRSSAGSNRISEESPLEIDRLFYTAVIGFAATVDLFSAGDRGGPGTFFECVMGPCIALLTGRKEASYIDVSVPDLREKKIRVTTDLSFLGDPLTLVIPTKISTRERISQAFVHQAILDKCARERYRSILCIANENNMGGGRSLATAFNKETLVPNTIILYQAFIAELAGLYYLDPPTPYMPAPAKFPPVKKLSSLLREDLPQLLIP